ncbi:MAG: hypothetical protein K2N16_07075 [Muribaculaceae bacterium]|nr:hypothetical protein [Muribaculaceae bacterium]
MKRLFLIFPLLAVLVIACRKPEPEIVKPLGATVPIEARAIVKVDLDAVLKMADCRSEGGRIELTPELSRLLRRWYGLPLLQACAAEGWRLDLKEAYWIDLGEGHQPVVTAMLKRQDLDQDEVLVDSLADGVAWLSDGRQAWLSLADGPELASTVDSILAKADSLNLLAAKGIDGEFFARPSTIKAVRRGENMANPIGDAFDAVYFGVDVRDRSISAQVRLASAGQWVDATSLMQPIDADAAFSDQPPGCVLVAAAGLTTNSVCRSLSAIPDLRFDRRFTLSIYARILAVNGTASLAMAPGGRAETIRNFDLRNWDVRFNLPIQGDPVKALDFADRYLPDYCYAEADSQYLYASTYEPGTYEPRSDFAPALAPGCLAVMVRIPYQSETMKALRLKSGYSIDFQADSALRLNVRLLGPAEYILPALITDL